jgi:hypothetical protein
MCLIGDRIDRHKAAVNIVMSLEVLQSTGNFLTDREAINF